MSRTPSRPRGAQHTPTSIRPLPGRASSNHGGALNLPPDVPEPIRHWLSTDHRNCRRQQQVTEDIIAVVDAWVPMSIDRGVRIEELERRVGRLERSGVKATDLELDLTDATRAANDALDELRRLVLRRDLLEVVDQASHLGRHRLELVDRPDQ